jgi:hypothetical protein
VSKVGIRLNVFGPSIWIFACHCQHADTINWGHDHILIQNSNGQLSLTKVGEPSERNNFVSGDKI